MRVPTEAELARADGRSFESAEEMLRRFRSAGVSAPSSRVARGRRRTAG